MLRAKVVEKQEQIETAPATLLPEIIDLKADLRKIVNGLRVKQIGENPASTQIDA